jgi:hypothetical protein
MIGVRLADIEPGHGGAGDVVVCIDEDGGGVDALHLGIRNGVPMPAGSLGREHCR